MSDRHCLMCGCGMSPQSTYYLCDKCQRIQQGAAPQVAAPQSTPSLAGTAETMTAEDAAWIVERGWLSPEGKARADRVAATYAALAERTAECERLRGLLDMTYSREDQEKLSAIFAARPHATQEGE